MPTDVLEGQKTASTTNDVDTSKLTHTVVIEPPKDLSSQTDSTPNVDAIISPNPSEPDRAAILAAVQKVKQKNLVEERAKAGRDTLMRSSEPTVADWKGKLEGAEELTKDTPKPTSDEIAAIQTNRQNLEEQKQKAWDQKMAAVEAQTKQAQALEEGDATDEEKTTEPVLGTAETAEKDPQHTIDIEASVKNALDSYYGAESSAPVVTTTPDGGTETLAKPETNGHDKIGVDLTKTVPLEVTAPAETNGVDHAPTLTDAGSTPIASAQPATEDDGLTPAEPPPLPLGIPPVESPAPAAPVVGTITTEQDQQLIPSPPDLAKNKPAKKGKGLMNFLRAFFAGRALMGDPVMPPIQYEATHPPIVTSGQQNPEGAAAEAPTATPSEVEAPAASPNIEVTSVTETQPGTPVAGASPAVSELASPIVETTTTTAPIVSTPDTLPNPPSPATQEATVEPQTEATPDITAIAPTEIPSPTPSETTTQTEMVTVLPTETATPAPTETHQLESTQTLGETVQAEGQKHPEDEIASEDRHRVAIEEGSNLGEKIKAEYADAFFPKPIEELNNEEMAQTADILVAEILANYDLLKQVYETNPDVIKEVGNTYPTREEVIKTWIEARKGNRAFFLTLTNDVHWQNPTTNVEVDGYWILNQEGLRKFIKKLEEENNVSSAQSTQEAA